MKALQADTFVLEGNSVKAENSHIEKNSIRKVLGLLMGLGISLSSPAFAYSPGKDGVGTVTTANTVINTYYTVTAGLTAGGSTVPLSSVTGLSVGDVLMLYQAQGATITTTNSAAYGAVTALNNAGRYELVSIVSIAANTVTINTDCSAGLRYSYTNGLTQAIRVPQYTSLTVSGAGSITSTAWNGTTGGVVAALVQNTASIGGAGITVAGQGFRGGVLDNVTTAAGTDVTLFVGASMPMAAKKAKVLRASKPSMTPWVDGMVAAHQQTAAAAVTHTMAAAAVEPTGITVSHGRVPVFPALQEPVARWRTGRRLGIWKALDLPRVHPVVVVGVVIPTAVPIRMQ